MLDERLRLVLRQHVDRERPRIDEIAEHEIDDPAAGGKLQAGLACCSVRGCSRVPLPPAMTIARIFIERAPIPINSNGVPPTRPSVEKKAKKAFCFSSFVCLRSSTATWPDVPAAIVRYFWTPS